MKTIDPNDPAYEWAPSGRQYDPKYPWDAWLDGSIHKITQGIDFESNPSTMIPLLRQRARQRDLKVTTTKEVNKVGQFIITFVSYAKDKHRPSLPIPQQRVNRYSNVTDAQESPPPLGLCRICDQPLNGNSLDAGECLNLNRTPKHPEPAA